MKKDQLPSFIIHWYTKKRWTWLALYFKRRANRYARFYLKKNRKAVDRIKDEFMQLTGMPPYANQDYRAEYWDEQIAKYVDSLGVKSLIDDMREAVSKYRNIRSILYFLHTDGKASRWENLWPEPASAMISEKRSSRNGFKKPGRNISIWRAIL